MQAIPLDANKLGLFAEEKARHNVDREVSVEASGHRSAELR
jgi:hypothetical protein